jgi:NAD(P) transhydrogenase subunit beta
VIAFGKLSGKIRSAPVVFGGQHWVNLLLALAMIGFGVWFFLSPDEGKWTPFIIMTALAFLLGFLLIIPIGGADMPVVISMLNSYSGWAAAGIGFSLDKPDADHRRVAGRLFRRDSVLHHVQGDEPLVLQRDSGRLRWRDQRGAAARRKSRSRTGSAEDAAFLLSNADTVIIVPGYGLAVGARAACREGTRREADGQRGDGQIRDPSGRRAHARAHERSPRRSRGSVRQVFEMEDINGEFGTPTSR